ncbi:MAG: sigma 54-interacting transcriptional regulator [bacterium]
MKKGEEDFPFLVGNTRAMRILWEKIRELAADPNPILIIGELGVGKELLAGIIHAKGPTRNRPFIIVDASEISVKDWKEKFYVNEAVLNKGGEEGLSRTMIPRTRFGFVELANGGTLLLKNIDALPLALQEGFINFLFNNDIGPDKEGCSSSFNICRDLAQIKIIFTSHINLEQKVKEGKFSPQLLEMISTRVVCMPPLRERKWDIPELTGYFMDKHSRRYKKNVNKLSPRSREQLLNYDYRRANIQELDEIIERGIVLSNTDTIHSEQLFLGAPADHPHVLFNLLKIKTFAAMVRKGIYPGLFRWIAVAFFFFIITSCFLGPQDPEKNWGTILVWWIWWPWLCAAAFWIGRTWCSFCAYATLGNSLQKRLNLNISFPKFLKNNDYILAALFFLFIVWVEEASNMRYKPVYTGMLLASILCLELIFSVFFPRDTWCRYVCPMGNLIGLFAMASIVEVRADPDICLKECKTDECYHGTKDKQGCPMFQHLMYVDNNQTCKLCLKCIRLCPHQSVSLNLRPPGREIWASNQVRPGMAFFVCVIMAILFPVIKPFNSFLLTTIAYLATPLIMIAIIWSISFISFYRLKGATYKAFWKAAYAYVPLTLCAHIAYQLQYIPWLRDLDKVVFFQGKALAGIGSILQLVQILFLAIGTFFSFYTINRIAKDKFRFEIRPGLSFWLGHSALMTVYPFLIWYLLR